jgi:hypothetical protein
MVQKGKLAAVAWALATRALKRVDLPTLGKPTIPALSMDRIYEPLPLEPITLVQTNSETGSSP